MKFSVLCIFSYFCRFNLWLWWTKFINNHLYLLSGVIKCFAVNASCNHCREDSDCSDFCENKYEQPKCADQGYYGSNFRCCVCKGEQQSYYFSVRISSLFLFIHFCDVFVSLSVIFLFSFIALCILKLKKIKKVKLMQ